jgi:transposase-like protein
MKKERTIASPLSKSAGYKLIEGYYRQGGIGAKSYYTQQGVSEWQFYNWRRRYLQEHPEWREVSPPIVEEKKKKVYPIEIEAPIRDEASSTAIEIRYPHGVILRFNNSIGIDITELTALVKIRV